MSQIVHITFEKLTGLKGDIEGDFIIDHGKIDQESPLVFIAFVTTTGNLVFNHGKSQLWIRAVQFQDNINYFEHFRLSVNLIIKEWSYGSGVDIGSKNPN